MGFDYSKLSHFFSKNMISIVTSSLRMVNIVRMFHLQTVIIAIVLYHHRFTSDGFFEDMWYNQNRKSAISISIYFNPVRYTASMRSAAIGQFNQLHQNF